MKRYILLNFLLVTAAAVAQPSESIVDESEEIKFDDENIESSNASSDNEESEEAVSGQDEPEEVEYVDDADVDALDNESNEKVVSEQVESEEPQKKVNDLNSIATSSETTSNRNEKIKKDAIEIASELVAPETKLNTDKSNPVTTPSEPVGEKESALNNKSVEPNALHKSVAPEKSAAADESASTIKVPTPDLNIKQNNNDGATSVPAASIDSNSQRSNESINGSVGSSSRYAVAYTYKMPSDEKCARSGRKMAEKLSLQIEPKERKAFVEAIKARYSLEKANKEWAEYELQKNSSDNWLPIWLIEQRQQSLRSKVDKYLKKEDAICDQEVSFATSKKIRALQGNVQPLKDAHGHNILVPQKTPQNTFEKNDYLRLDIERRTRTTTYYENLLVTLHLAWPDETGGCNCCC